MAIRCEWELFFDYCWLGNFRVRNDSYTGGSRCGNRIINGYEHAREISPGGAQLLETPPEVREEAKPTTERKVGFRYVIYVKPRRGDTRPLSLTSQSAPLSLSACVASPRLDYICSFYPPPYHSVTSFPRFQVGFLTVAPLRGCG